MVVLKSSDPIHAAAEVDGLQENKTTARLLKEIAVLQEQQQANAFRVKAYRAAVKTIEELPTSIRDLLQHDGIDGLIALPTIGKSIANLIDSNIRLGRLPLLDRLRGESNAETYFTKLPGIGPELSRRIYDHLHIETLPELYAAAQQGRLAEVPGLGRKRVRAIQESLETRIGNTSDVSAFLETDRSIPVDDLLAIDE
ncbi:DNA polymerase/3'-5' exonuclease PolX [Rubripirellula tenax]|uniref:DNA polymerase/3'-5' exonuclease PolX n=1 Tax=Rubripirellula tenax TaxID=2528015 RepID=A0A5C6EEI6_9BACT|nr:helix-hairpin-helix domain-containing protein [Rubripirellula tenax]TWU46141.1 DNA polymerase/3'-5' exonuclease PolX [Rubripirellula tenax]